MARRDKNIAKNEIYGAFKDFIKSGQTKVTVSALIEATGMNRKTFYNHFSNQDELVAWGFRRDLLNVLLAHCVMEDLVNPPYDLYEFEGLPCYFRTPANALSLDQTKYWNDFWEVFLSDKDYYRTLLRSEFGPQLTQYLVELFRGLFLEDVEYFLGGRKMPEEAKRIVAGFYSEGIVHHVVDTLLGIGSQTTIDGVGPVSNLAHEGMLHIVEAYQSEKSDQYFQSRRFF